MMAPMGNHALGAMLGSGALHALANAYREAPAISPQTAALGMALGMGALDPFAAYRGGMAPAFLQGGYW